MMSDQRKHLSNKLLYMPYNPKKGFTLIELLVVIRIIALLSTIVLGALQGAREKARDRALASSVLQLQNAVEIYKTNHGRFPGEYSTTAKVVTVDDDGVITYTSGQSQLVTEVTEFIENLPVPTTGVVQYWINYKATRRCGPTSVNQPYFISFNVEGSGLDNWPEQHNSSDGINWTAVAGRKCISIQ